MRSPRSADKATRCAASPAPWAGHLAPSVVRFVGIGARTDATAASLRTNELELGTWPVDTFLAQRKPPHHLAQPALR